MIPQKIQALFNFIDYLDENKTKYVEKYIPLCSELEVLKEEQRALRPRENYIDKQKHDEIQNQIEEKFVPIMSDIYSPITNKLRELKIWSGDETYASVWNNNIDAIANFKQNFNEEDVKQVMQYKRKYLRFRSETNSNFLCLALVFDSLDEILKVLFDFFKDEIIMGDKIKTGNISNRDGQISVGKENNNRGNSSDNVAKKTLSWQKWAVVIAIVAIIVTVVISL